MQSRVPPRPTIDPIQPPSTVPLEQLWTRLPPANQHELLTHLSRMLAQRLTPPTGKEEADRNSHSSTYCAKQVSVLSSTQVGKLNRSKHPASLGQDH